MDNKTALLIDARNAIYRAVWAVKADNRHANKYHYFVILLRQITSWLNKYRPESVHVFWDAPRETVWRRKALKTYKDRTKSTYVEDISADLALTTAVAKDFFKVMNVRQYEKKEMEADDLIYSAVTILHPQPTVIVSTDGDMLQIPYMLRSCTVYDPKKQEEASIPEVNPVIQKALVGDKSDAIDGYYSIGPKKSAAMMQNPSELQDFLATAGRQIYHRNLLLVDLSLNPRLLANKVYVQRILATDVTFDSAEINKLALHHKVNGFLAEHANLVPPFKKLA